MREGQGSITGSQQRFRIKGERAKAQRRSEKKESVKSNQGLELERVSKEAGDEKNTENVQLK